MRRHLATGSALAAVLLAIAGGTSWAAEPSSNPAVAALIRQGDFWSGKGRQDLAADAYRKALATEPNNAAARAGLARVNAGGGARPSAPSAPAGGADLDRARALARGGDNAAAAAAYRKAFKGGAPPDSVALEYYQTLAGAPGGLAQAQAGLRDLAAKRPGDARVQLALGQALTYRDATRREGVALLSRMAAGGGPQAGAAATAWRQALVWMDDAPRNASLFTDYLAARPGDAEITRKLAAANQPARTPVGPAVDPIAKTRAEGYAALEADNLTLAESRFQAAIARRANDADALGGLGLVRLRSQRFAEAADLLERAGRANPSGATRWRDALSSARFYGGLQEAQASLDAGRAADAERVLRPLTAATYKDRALAQDLLAEALQRQGRPAEAEVVYRDILATAPGRADAQRGLVQALLDQNRLAEADALAARSPGLQLDATGQNATRGRLERDRANKAWAAGDLSGANQAFEAALSAAPADPWVRVDFARFLAGQGEAAAAQGLMAPVDAGDSPEQIRASATYADQQGRSAEALARLSRLPPGAFTPEVSAMRSRLEVDAAVEQAKRGGGVAGLRAIASRPDLPPAAVGRLTTALYDQGDEQGALALAQQALITGTSGAPADYDGAVTVLARAGRDAEAAALIRQAAAGVGANPAGVQAVADLTASLAAERADRLRKSGDLANAFEVLSAGFAVAPRNPRLLAPLGRLYQDGRMYGEAIGAYEALLRAKPGDQEGLMGLADAFAAKGDIANARRVAAQAVAAAPQDPEAYLLSARIERQAGDESAALGLLRKARALRSQPMLAGPGGGLDAILAPGAAPAQATTGLGPNPFTRGKREAQPPVAQLSPVSANPFVPVSNPAPMAPPYVASPPGAASPYAGVAFPITGRSGRDLETPRPVRTYAPAQAANPFSTPVADPVADDIDRQIAELTARTAAEVAGSAKIRTRSGEAGLSRLDELSAKGEVSTSLGQARLTASIEPVSIDAGSPGGSAEQRFGGNQIVNARAIVGAYKPVYPAAGAQSAAGAAVTLALQLGPVNAEVGTTPIGFGHIDAVGGLSWSPRLGRSGQGKVWVERRPVTDSVVAYAGARDPVTGERWGQVMRTGGGASLSYDDGASGLYADASYSHYDGRHVLDNDSYQVNLGGYVRPYRRGDTEVQVGFNLNQQGYDNNQNFFSLGQGGYFSPKSFTSITAPVSVSTRLGAWKLKGEVAPGYQTYSQAGAAYFPMDPGLQAELNGLATADADVFPRYLAQSSSGFGVAGGLSGDYQFRPGTALRGALRFNTFGDYNETSISVGVRQTLGEGASR